MKDESRLINCAVSSAERFVSWRPANRPARPSVVPDGGFDLLHLVLSLVACPWLFSSASDRGCCFCSCATPQRRRITAGRNWQSSRSRCKQLKESFAAQAIAPVGCLDLRAMMSNFEGGLSSRHFPLWDAARHADNVSPPASQSTVGESSGRFTLLCADRRSSAGGTAASYVFLRWTGAAGASSWDLRTDRNFPSKGREKSTILFDLQMRKDRNDDFPCAVCVQ
jgi:hypothetical protein